MFLNGKTSNIKLVTHRDLSLSQIESTFFWNLAPTQKFTSLLPAFCQQVLPDEKSLLPISKMTIKFSMRKIVTIFFSPFYTSMTSASLELTIASSGGNTSSPLKYGMLYEVS